MTESTQADKYNLKILHTFPQIGIVHHIDNDNTIFGTKNRNIYKYYGNKISMISRFPRTYPRDFFTFSRILARAARADKSNIYVNTNQKMIGIRGGVVYAIDENAGPRPLFTIQGDCVLHRGICEDKEGWSYFGEYFINPQRTSVYIYRIEPDLKSWEVAYKFAPGKIRHVHNIFSDPYDKNLLWVTVGDYENECYILKTDDRFKTVRYFGNGEQIWRAVTLYFTESHICWITDSHLEQNYAYRMNRRTGKIERGQKFACSSWYGCTTKQGVHVAFTTVESGSGIQGNESSIYVSEDAYNWQEIFSFKKDRYRPYSIFKNGVISCPSGSPDLENFYISGEGLIGLDGLTLCTRIYKSG
jgi:hypothetical protein